MSPEEFVVSSSLIRVVGLPAALSSKVQLPVINSLPYDRRCQKRAPFNTEMRIRVSIYRSHYSIIPTPTAHDALHRTRKSCPLETAHVNSRRLASALCQVCSRFADSCISRALLTCPIHLIMLWDSPC